MNIYNLEIHKQCGLYSLPEDGSIKIMDRKEETEVLFLEEKLTYSKLLLSGTSFSERPDRRPEKDLVKARSMD